MFDHIDPEDMEAERTQKNERKKLEVPLESAMQRNIATKHRETWCTQDNSRKTRYACKDEARESTRTRIGMTQPRNHKYVIAEKLYNSLSQPSCPPPQAMKIQDSHAACDKEWKSSRNCGHGK